jgi:hypothetical protein
VHKRIVQLIKTSFLAILGHNTHCQQQKLSKFLMRYQQFVSHAYCGATGPMSKMASQQEKAFCVIRFEVSTSAVTVQREFRARFNNDAPHKNEVTKWYRQFVETGCLCKGRRPVDLVCLMTTLKECVRRFSEFPASLWLEQAGNWAC